MSEDDNNSSRPGVGIPIDSRGGPTVDPTKNVLDLVRAESKYQDSMRQALKEYEDGMREASEKYQTLMVSSSAVLREAELRLQNWMRDSESKRVDQLASLRQVYETRIAEMLAVSVKSTSDLVSTQLVQIQATFNDRVSKLEQFRWESGGKSSVSDPAIADALARLTSGLSSQSTAFAEAIAAMTTANAESLAKLSANVSTIGTSENRSIASRMGQGQLAQWVVMSVMMFASVGSAIIAAMALRGHP
jgi:hypothetical protein